MQQLGGAGDAQVASPPPALCPVHSWLKHTSRSHLVIGNAPVPGTPPDAHPGGSQPLTHGQPWPQCGVLLLPVMFWRSQTGIVYKEPAESCKDSAVRCDGVVDCSQRSDELGCGEAPGAGMVRMRGSPGRSAPLTLLLHPTVRFSSEESLLHVYSSTESQWLPVCSSDWDESLSRKTCRQLGFQK